MPNSDDELSRRRPSSSRTGTASSGSRSRPAVLTSAVLGEKILPPEAGDEYKADYDIELWGWSGGIDPNGLLQIFKCDAIGASSDSQYCNPAYDQMYDEQLKAPDAAARKAILSQMQNLIYDQAVYDILYYDANLEAYRTDRFAGWQKQPSVERHAVLHVQHARLHEADRRQGGAAGRTVRGGRLRLAVLGPGAAPSSAAVGSAAPVASAAPGSVDSGSSLEHDPDPHRHRRGHRHRAAGLGLSRRRSGKAATAEEDE